MLRKLILPGLLLFFAAQAAAAQTLPIAEIHGEGHVAATLGREVTTEGIVTLVADSTVWIQTAGQAGLRSGLAIEMAETPQLARGDLIRVSGRIEQQRPENRPQDLVGHAAN